MIDEVQRAPDLFFAIKQVVDQDRTPGKFLLTVSADVLLLPRVGEALTGRTELMTLHPLSQGEMAGRVEGFIDALFESSTLEAPQGTEVTSDEIVSRVALGGYPEALRRRTAKRRQSWFDAYVALLVQRDIQDLANIEHATAVPRILRLLATRSSSTLNYANLASDLQLPQTTLKRYLAYLETLFLHQPVPAWLANIGKRLVKSPKLALVDTGLAAALVGPEAKVLAVYHDDPESTDPSKLRSGACLTVPDGSETGGEVAKMTIPGGRFAVARVEIDVDQFGEAWKKVMEWIFDNGYEPDDRMCYEVYLNDHEQHPQRKFILDICEPVRAS